LPPKRSSAQKMNQVPLKEQKVNVAKATEESTNDANEESTLLETKTSVTDDSVDDADVISSLLALLESDNEEQSTTEENENLTFGAYVQENLSQDDSEEDNTTNNLLATSYRHVYVATWSNGKMK
jgi:hypothetical protein